MVDDLSEDAPPPPPPAGPSRLHWIATIAGLSIIATALGSGAGIELAAMARHNLQDMHPAAASKTRLIDLPPVITNLADPVDSWVRLQASIVIDDEPSRKPELMAAEIANDILGFMKTVTVSEIGGASGLQHLREDLTERAEIRSQGRVHELIIQTLVVQ
ncbi:MAG TPA: flagellar basal body-associated FliL family protein [Methylovirgula sp.]|nr:flagellar basal body-associated FliL family protein [Methylovirgula sp.]